MSVSTPTGLSGSRRKRNIPVKIDVSVNDNSPSSPIDGTSAAIPSNNSTPILVIRSDSKEDSPGGNLGFQLQPPEPSVTPVTPIFTPTQSSQSIISHPPFDNEEQHINVTETTTILTTSHMIQAVDNPLSLSSDLNNSREDLNKSSSSEGSVTTFKEHIPPRVVAIQMPKDFNQGKSHKLFSTEKPTTQPDSQKNDSYCWSCHEGGNVVCCDNCPRVFHLKCAHIESEPPEDHDWLCPICTKMRSNKRRRGESPPNLTELLGFVIKKLKFEGTDQFQQEVREEIAPGYRDLIFHPMDLGKIDRNLAKYEATSHLRYEVEWVLHNCIIYNGTRHSLTKTARQIVKMCRTELSEIEYCANCYKLSCTRPIGWFSQICDSPHAVVLAKVKGHPQWPGKLINKGREKYEVRFFGREHMRATVPINCVYPLRDGEILSPPSNSKTAGYWPDAVSELKLYQANLRAWMLAHPEHKLILPDISDAIPLSSSISVDKSKPLENSTTSTDLMPAILKSISEFEEPSLPSPSVEHTPSLVYPPTSDPAPISMFSSNSVLNLTPDIELGTSKFPSDESVPSQRLMPKDLSQPPKPGLEKEPGATRFLLSETASEDEVDDPSFKMNQKQAGRTRKRKPGPGESKPQNKKLVFSGMNNRVVTAGRGRGRKIDIGNRKPLHYQFPPSSLNNDKPSSSLKRDLAPLVQDVSLSNSGFVPELMERNLNLSIKHLEHKSVSEEAGRDHIHSKYSKMFLDKFERLILDLISDLNTGQVDHIQQMLDGIVAREVRNRDTEVYSEMREEMQRLIEQCHEVAKIEVERHSSEIRRDCDKRLDQQVRDTKKKTWCSYCWSEAYYNCCWNVNYCSEKCQKLDWLEHKPHCIQILNTPTHSDTANMSGHGPTAHFDNHPTSSRDRADSISMDTTRHRSSVLENESNTLSKRNASIDNSKEIVNQEESFTQHERALDYKSPLRFNAPPTSTVPLTNATHHLQDKIKVEKHLPPPNPHFMNSQHKPPPNTTATQMDNSTATTPVHGKLPSFPPGNSSQMASKEHFESYPRSHLRYSSISAVSTHQSQSPRGQQTPAPVSGVSQSLSQLKSNNPGASGLVALAASTQLKESASHKQDGYKRMRETASARTGAQSPHPSVNPAMFQGPLEPHNPQAPHSFIIHSGAPPVAGAPTTPTSNQPKLLQNPFHPNIAPPNIYQIMNGDISTNLMMRYPFPIANQGGLIQNQGTLQPSPHSMTPRPHD